MGIIRVENECKEHSFTMKKASWKASDAMNELAMNELFLLMADWLCY